MHRGAGRTAVRLLSAFTAGQPARSIQPLGLAFLLFISHSELVLATPPEYRSFHRTQRIDVAIHEPDVLRIWAVYVGQGDALLIQFPSRLAREVGGQREPVEVLVDGGPGLALKTFLDALAPKPTRLEHVVLTHHDADHVAGLTKLLADNRIAVERIYHNGLATWNPAFKHAPDTTPTPRSITDGDKLMAFLEEDGSTLLDDYLIHDLDELRQARRGFLDPYADFAAAIVDKTTPSSVAAYFRSHRGGSFINEAQAAPPEDSVAFELLWPRDPPRRYRQWSYTINGNSVTFRLTYRDFSMLFSGDHNDASEVDLLGVLTEAETTASLTCDVLKVPHHGSPHNDEGFFDVVDPVVSVASMGGRGFPWWQHPATAVIRALGGNHRVYHTFIHERPFRYASIRQDGRDSMIESKHVLIETDGHWFRIVETEDPRAIPTVRETRRGNGTRWIRARGEE